MERYHVLGFGLWAVCLKTTGEMIGDCGLTMQNINGTVSPEIGYHIANVYQRQGYAKEAAQAVRDWTFANTTFGMVYSYMKKANIPSSAVARANGMALLDEFTDGENELTIVYGISREEWVSKLSGFGGGKVNLTEATNHFSYIDLRKRPQLKEIAAEWFSGKWNIPVTAYLACMNDYLTGKTEYGWFLCLDGDQIVGGLGVIENDFHDRKDLTPNVCAVYTEKEYRGKGIAGRLLCMAVENLRARGIFPVYLLTDHVGFYERYGWEFLCMVQGDGEAKMSRMYVHK